LTVPFDDDDRFLIGLSYGTLVQGIFDEKLFCTLSALIEGAGIVQLHAQGFTLDWKAEWIGVSAYSACRCAMQSSEPLPLFPELDRWVA
jgi:hypothetical protein